MSVTTDLPEIFQKNAADTDQKQAYTPSSVEKQASDLIFEMSKKYPDWALSDVANLKRLLNDARSLTGTVRERLIREDLYRTAHDMKGQGATFGYPLITDVAAHLCAYIKKATCFEWLQLSDIQKDITDLEHILSHKLSGDGGETGLSIRQRLQTDE
ncbi:MAG: hypothetical protein ACI4QM_02905 [Alphaproteobacteria bacterium]